jgi:hypothetical protein
MFEDLSTKSHQNCDEKACIAYRVPDESAYPTQHVNGCNGHCDVLHSEMDKIAQVYMSRGIPFIFVEKGKESNSTSKYVFGIMRMIPQIHPPLYTQNFLMFGLTGSEVHLSKECLCVKLISWSMRVWFEISKAVLRGCGTLLDL